MDTHFLIKKTVKSKPPGLPFLAIKKEVLGGAYDLSLVFVGNALSRKLNGKYRGKDKPANILSFPLDKNEGEIFINPREAKKDAPRFKKSYNTFIGFLFIHGCLHLKGLKHGKKMDAEEKRLCKRFGF